MRRDVKTSYSKSFIKSSRFTFQIDENKDVGGSWLKSLFGRLERVPQGELHDSRRSLNLGEVRPLGRRALASRILRQTESRATGVVLPHTLRVSYVKDLPTELQVVVFVVRHSKALAESGIQIYVAGYTEPVAFTGFTWIGTPKTLVRRESVTPEELRVGTSRGASRH